MVDEKYIPEDGSKEVIEKFEKNTGADVIVFPDVHMKKGAMIANGMLVSSPNNIYLSCLGVENCGFTFGRICEADEEKLISGFEQFSELLRSRKRLPRYTKNEIKEIFDNYLKEDFVRKRFLYNFLGFNDIDDLLEEAHNILDDSILKLASESLCTLGGGNHFFEIHKITEVFETETFSKGDYVFMLHSDSISVGDRIYVLYSDLHELKKTGSMREKYRIGKLKMYQHRYFKRLCKKQHGISEDLKKIFQPENDYQAIDVKTPLGRNLLLAHNLSSVFGEMNRDAIIKTWSDSQEVTIEKTGSHSHDNITIEMHEGEMRTVHRNGVQNIGQDEYCILPSAMGDYSYILRNMNNEKAYFSTNHGTGRIQDKHIARENYTEELTKQEMQERNVKLFRVGKGNLAEQNMHAFKEPQGIIKEMELNKLAKKAAKTYPIAVIKG